MLAEAGAACPGHRAGVRKAPPRGVDPDRTRPRSTAPPAAASRHACPRRPPSAPDPGRATRDRLRFFVDLHAAHGDVVALPLGGERLVLLAHPEAIRTVLGAPQGRFKKGLGLERARMLLGDGLLTSEGDLHRRQRRLVQPAFHKERLAAYGATMVRHAEALAADWRTRSSDSPVETSGAMHALALAIAGETFFGADVTGDVGLVARALDDALAAFDVALSPLYGVLRRLPGVPVIRRFDRAQRDLDALIARLVAARRREGPGRDDLLGLLLAARDTAGDGTGMDERQLRDEILTLLTAGHETTANLLTWSAWAIAGDDALQQAMRDEVAQVVGAAPLDPSHATQLPLVRAVVSETLRLHPPAWVMGRRALVDHEVDGWTIPAGTTVLATQYIVHRDPRWWPDPLRFDPARWLDARADAARPRFAFFPFGAGARMCIGDQFAWMEATLVLAALVRAVHLTRPPDTPPPREIPSITLRAERPVPLLVRAV
ncbi:MAG: cytochrome P450 [Gemmatimonadaceae bacterium]|nr:cytochrome P450 [Gemmatimonadaceae bacterium]